MALIEISGSGFSTDSCKSQVTLLDLLNPTMHSRVVKLLFEGRLAANQAGYHSVSGDTSHPF